MKKRFLLIVVFLLLTGCSTKYELIINDDLTVTEEATLGGTNEFYSNYYKTTKKNVLKTILDSNKEVLEENNYEYQLITNNNNPYVYIKKEYKNVSEYIEKTILLNDYFDKINYTESNNIKKIETEGFHENNPDDPNRFYVRDLEIAIKCPYKVTNHNASTINKESNTYYFNLNESKKILLEYDISKKFNPNAYIYTTLLLFLIVVIVSWLTVVIINKKNK